MASDQIPQFDNEEPRFDKNPVIDNSPGRRYYYEKDSELKELVPTIWPFKAEWVEFVGEERLPQWEEMMREKVGIELDARMPAKPGCATESGSGDGWDDCDYWGNGC